MPRLAKNFDQLDANHDGKVTLDEIRAGMKKMHDQRMRQMPRNRSAQSDGTVEPRRLRPTRTQRRDAPCEEARRGRTGRALCFSALAR
ncbi:hypothetical protein ACU4GD_38185 [Cupriavidus basilensis]